MRLFGTINTAIDDSDRAQYMTPPFDRALSSGVMVDRPDFIYRSPSTVSGVVRRAPSEDSDTIRRSPSETSSVIRRG